jgi:hypothetical protein
MYCRVIACEIAFREICHSAARSPNILDLEFLPQGYHDIPKTGLVEIQKRIEAVPAQKYDVILLGYGLCSNIITGLTSLHTPLVIPRAHDCITFFLGSKERYQEFFGAHPGTYYYTSGWLECVRRRGEKSLAQGTTFMPSNVKGAADSIYQQWVEKYGEDEAKYLLETMGGWAQAYDRGALIDFDFTRSLNLSAQVQKICAERGWKFEAVEGDVGLLQRWLDGPWDPKEFLVVPPRHKVAPSFGEGIVRAEPFAPPNGEG